MRRKDHIAFLRVDPGSITPIYRQLAGSILRGIESGELAKGDILPSLHQVCVALDISRNSVERAYNVLKGQGVLGSVQGKGYYVKQAT